LSSVEAQAITRAREFADLDRGQATPRRREHQQRLTRFQGAAIDERMLRGRVGQSNAAAVAKSIPGGIARIRRASAFTSSANAPYP